ncbi:hypothetical protein [Wenxinia saemankumensis]|uniref:Sulfide dehydrogenase (Flavocytochrome c), cytochrome c subunit n=1 Tax=Wenxinia saemankumensis TaxID=1447782 RepID=A0A1M6HCV9_9RHOB|nr:hypothetical protein [Wenxinia saemankumensis]SHJ20001.1 sulfide dehydrogenase (flavocytochrome c), cytochrome c subunit [Wenxinia saemankumensis]
MMTNARQTRPLGLLVLAAWPVAAAAQDFDPTLTDPAEIALQCGGSSAAGEIVFAQCAVCHEIGEDAESGVGPHLQEFVGRLAGSLEDFAYSPALVALGEQGVTWERDSMHAMLADPASMGFPENHPVVADEQARNDLMTYLRTHTLPPAPAIGEVAVPEHVLAMEGDAAYGEYLSGECAACHVPGGTDDIPGITGMARGDLMLALYEYRERARPNSTMQLVAQSLGEAEIAALAAYFEGAAP